MGDIAGGNSNGIISDNYGHLSKFLLYVGVTSAITLRNWMREYHSQAVTWITASNKWGPDYAIDSLLLPELGAFLHGALQDWIFIQCKTYTGHDAAFGIRQKLNMASSMRRKA